jgi:hypothetical protein
VLLALHDVNMRSEWTSDASLRDPRVNGMLVSFGVVGFRNARGR